MQYASAPSIGATDAARSRWARPETLWVASWLLLCLPWLIGTKVIPYDAVQQFFPAVSFSAEQLRNLQAPWWNPYLFGGYPQIADPQMMTLQPTMVLPMLLAPASLHLFTLVVLLHVLAGGFGALRLARSFGLSAPAQWFFAMVLMFGAVAASRLQHTPMIVSYSLLPWIWLGLSTVRNRGRARDVLLAGLAGGLCALQLTQVTYFIILACAVYAAGAVLSATGKRFRLALQLSAVALIAAAVSAPQWLSTLAWLGDTNRDGMTLEMALAGAMHWQGLVTLLSGNVFSQVRGVSWSFGDITTDYLYFGAVPLALWLAWGGSVVHRQRRATCLALGVLLLTTLVALGDVTPGCVGKARTAPAPGVVGGSLCPGLRCLLAGREPRASGSLCVAGSQCRHRHCRGAAAAPASGSGALADRTGRVRHAAVQRGNTLQYIGGPSAGNDGRAQWRHAARLYAARRRTAHWPARARHRLRHRRADQWRGCACDSTGQWLQPAAVQ